MVSDKPAQFRNILCPGKEGERFAPILLPEILFSATVLRCIAEFFLDKRRERTTARFLPPSFLSSPREKGFFPTTLFAKIRSNGFPPLFPPAASSSPCNGQYLPKLKGKMAMGRKMTREIPLPPPEGREGGRGRGGWINNQGSESDDSWIFPFLFRKKVGD